MNQEEYEYILKNITISWINDCVAADYDKEGFDPELNQSINNVYVELLRGLNKIAHVLGLKVRMARVNSLTAQVELFIDPYERNKFGEVIIGEFDEEENKEEP